MACSKTSRWEVHCEHIFSMENFAACYYTLSCARIPCKCDMWADQASVRNSKHRHLTCQRFSFFAGLQRTL